MGRVRRRMREGDQIITASTPMSRPSLSQPRRGARNVSPMPDAVTMSKIVSLARRAGSASLERDLRRSRLGVRMARRRPSQGERQGTLARGDGSCGRQSVALDSSIILHPCGVEQAPARRGLLDRRIVSCKLIAQTTRTSDRSGQRRSKHPGETEQCDLTEPRHFIHADGPVEEAGSDGDGAGDLHLIKKCRADRQAQLSVSPRSARRSQPDDRTIFRTLEFEQTEMEYFCRGGAVSS